MEVLMESAFHLFYGIFMAYFGLISPGMLNMTALRTRLIFGKKQSVKFAVGAAFVVLIQAAIALFFAEFFVNNPHIISKLKIGGIVVFFVLSIVFYLQSRKKMMNKNATKGNFFIKGMAMSAINMLAVPFYLGISVFLASENKIILEIPYIFYFITGASIGSFLLFYTYISFAKIINNRISFIAKNINILLSILFFSLGIVTLIKLIM